MMLLTIESTPADFDRRGARASEHPADEWTIIGAIHSRMVEGRIAIKLESLVL
jgi:hypothetical protein